MGISPISLCIRGAAVLIRTWLLPHLALTLDLSMMSVGLVMMGIDLFICEMLLGVRIEGFGRFVQ